MQNFANEKPSYKTNIKSKMHKHTKQRHNHKANNPSLMIRKEKSK
jgi:hypothetical protein